MNGEYRTGSESEDHSEPTRRCLVIGEQFRWCDFPVSVLNKEREPTMREFITLSGQRNGEKSYSRRSRRNRIGFERTSYNSLTRALRNTIQRQIIQREIIRRISTGPCGFTRTSLSILPEENGDQCCVPIQFPYNSKNHDH